MSSERTERRDAEGAKGEEGNACRDEGRDSVQGEDHAMLCPNVLRRFLIRSTPASCSQRPTWSSPSSFPGISSQVS